MEISHQVAYRRGAQAFKVPLPRYALIQDNVRIGLPANDPNPLHGYAERERFLRNVERAMRVGARVSRAIPIPALRVASSILDLSATALSLWRLGKVAYQGYPYLDAWATNEPFGFTCSWCGPTPQKMRRDFLPGSTSSCSVAPLPTWNCLNFQVPSGTNPNWGDPITITAPPAGQRWALSVGLSQVSGTRMKIEKTWVTGINPTGKTLTYENNPAVAPSWAPAIAPRYNPQIYPMGLPIQVPVRDPRPLPWRLLPRVRFNKSLVEQSNNGPRPRPRPRPRVKPITPVVVTPPGPPKPPGPKVKEGKYDGKGGKLRALLYGAQKAMHGYTEARDFVNALHGALPKRYQSTSKRIDNRLMALYENLDKMDISKAAYRLIQNEILDHLIGRRMGIGSKAMRKAGVTLGPGGYGYIPGRER